MAVKKTTCVKLSILYITNRYYAVSTTSCVSESPQINPDLASLVVQPWRNSINPRVHPLHFRKSFTTRCVPKNSCAATSSVKPCARPTHSTSSMIATCSLSSRNEYTASQGTCAVAARLQGNCHFWFEFKRTGWYGVTSRLPIVTSVVILFWQRLLTMHLICAGFPLGVRTASPFLTSYKIYENKLYFKKIELLVVFS